MHACWLMLRFNSHCFHTLRLAFRNNITYASNNDRYCCCYRWAWATAVPTASWSVTCADFMVFCGVVQAPVNEKEPLGAVITGATRGFGFALAQVITLAPALTYQTG